MLAVPISHQEEQWHFRNNRQNSTTNKFSQCRNWSFLPNGAHETKGTRPYQNRQRPRKSQLLFIFFFCLQYIEISIRGSLKPEDIFLIFYSFILLLFLPSPFWFFLGPLLPFFSVVTCILTIPKPKKSTTLYCYSAILFQVELHKQMKTEEIKGLDGRAIATHAVKKFFDRE